VWTHQICFPVSQTSLIEPVRKAAANISDHEHFVCGACRDTQSGSAELAEITRTTRGIESPKSAQSGKGGFRGTRPDAQRGSLLLQSNVVFGRRVLDPRLRTPIVSIAVTWGPQRRVSDPPKQHFCTVFLGATRSLRTKREPSFFSKSQAVLYRISETFSARA